MTIISKPNKLSATDLFTEAFRELLRKRYGKIPSAAFVAREFNKTTDFNDVISSETARRWINGYSAPEIHRLAVLCQLLNAPPDCFIPYPQDGIVLFSEGSNKPTALHLKIPEEQVPIAYSLFKGLADRLSDALNPPLYVENDCGFASADTDPPISEDC